MEKIIDSIPPKIICRRIQEDGEDVELLRLSKD